MRFYTFLLAALIGLGGLQLAEAKTKHPKPHHASAHKMKNQKYRHQKVKKFKH